MSITRQGKERILSSLSDELRSCGSMVMTDFSGIDVAGMTRLRNELRSTGVRYMVVKNTLLRRVFGEIEIAADQGVFGLAQGPTALAWAPDEVLPVKVLKKFADGNNGRPVIKGGYVSGRSCTAAEMLTLADLPGREELLARVLGSMSAPLQGFVNVTGGVLRGFLNAVSALGEKRGESQ